MTDYMKKGILAFVLLSSLTLTGCEITFSDEPTNIVEEHSLYIVNRPNKTTYQVNDAFTLEGLKVIDNKTGENITDYSSSLLEGSVLLEVGTIDVTISKTNYKSTSFSINVTEAQAALEIAQLPKVVFEYGEYFTISGLVVTCNGEIVTDYKVSYMVGNALNSPGEKEIIISKDGYTSVSYTITVKKQKTLSVAQQPTITNYQTGDAFTLAGLVIQNENGEVVTNYQTSIADGATLKYAGDIEVIISLDGYQSVSLIIHVEENTSVVTKEKDINIYYINDTHGAFPRFVYGNSYEAGMSYISTYIKNEVAKNPDGSLVLSGGDMFQGGLESNVTKGQIMIDAMNEIGFDAMALGNHEFDWGEETLIDICEKLNCPVLSANTFYLNGDRPSYIEPYTIVQKGDVKIGIIGGAQQGLDSSITGSISSNFDFPNPRSYICDYSDELRMNYNCDIIIAIFHDKGFEGTSGEASNYLSGITQVSEVSHTKYVDAMFFAHDHIGKQGTYNGVPYLEAGKNGRYIGEMTLSLSGKTTYSVTGSETNLVQAYNATKTLTPDSKIEALTSKYSELIGNPNECYYTFANSYSDADFTNVVCQAMLWYVNDNPSYFDNKTVYFASHNTGGVRSDVYAGDFTKRILYRVFPFDNQLSMQRCTSTHLNNMRNSSYYRTYEIDPIIYDGSYTNAISITYITEYKYASRYQASYKNYNYTAKDALLSFLTSSYGASLHL